MANYVSTHTGAEIDAAVDAAIPFEAVYGSTTYAEIKAAHDAGRTLSARKGFQRFQLANFVAAAISFSLANAGTKTITLLTVTNADAWSETVLDIGAELAAIQAASAPAILNTASGAVCSFADGSASPMTSVIAEIVAKQDAPILPAGYCQLDYIASSGTQYIDTGYAVSVENMRYVGKFNFSATDATMTWFGHQRGSIRSGQFYGPRGRVYAGSSNAIMEIGVLATDTDYSVDLTVNNGNATLIANGVTQTATYEGTIIEATRPIYLFGLNAGSGMIYPISGKCYYFKMYQGTTLVRDFVPCVRQADGVLGMYDLVGEAFYANAGTGDFIAGPPTSRPITGYTGANITRAGANVWDEQWELGGIDPDTGATTVANDRIRSKDYIRVFPSTSYYFKDGHLSGYTLRLFFYDKDKNFVSASGWLNASGAFTTGADVHFMKFIDASVTTYGNDISINYPSSDTAYHAYAGEVFSVSWQDEAGTVYFGYIDLVSGTLTVTHKAVDLGASAWTRQSTAAAGKYCFYKEIADANGAASASEVFDGLCTIAAPESLNATYTPLDGIALQGTACKIYLEVYSAMTAADFRTAVTGQTLVYPLATAETYTLTPQEIASLLGDNTLWNDVGGDTSAEYRADTKLYIQSLLGA